ncbi:MAG: hypothetical protein KF751_02975 [Nitrospira sp.]|nr:hypothetical protein [Nitrospira sp.]MBX3347605.1 hypothetical protein [Nitrospira sp.]
MQRRWMVPPVIGLLWLVSLSACSGEGDTPTPAPPALTANPAEGIWRGTTNSNRAVTGLVLDNGAYWLLYSAVGNPSLLEGFIQGTSSAQSGAFTSSDARDFNLQTGLLTGTINGSYVTKQNLSGTIAYQNSTQSTFSTAYDTDYELTPDPNAIAGTYSGSVTATETATAVLTSTGTVSGSSSAGCLFSGTFVPRTDGNVFTVTITFGGQSGCTLGTQTVNGIGLFDAVTKQLTSAAWNSGKTDGFVFIGTKP